MLEELRLGNFRAFESAKVRFAKITLVFGPNNSGKSALLSAINLLSQTLESSDRRVALLLNGTKEELGTYADVAYNNSTKRELSIGVSVSGETAKKATGKESDLAPGTHHLDLKFRYRPVLKEIQLQELRIGNASTDRQMQIARNASGAMRAQIGQAGVPPSTGGRGFEVDFFNYLPMWRFGKKDRDAFDPFRYGMGEIFSLLRGVEYLGPFRELPARTYLFSGERPSSVGLRGERASELLVTDRGRRGKHRRDLLTKVSAWFKAAGIGEGVAVENLTPRHYEIRVQHPTTMERQNLADVGFGCSQILPVLVGGYNLSAGGLFIVEQPELHLHPKAQAELGEFFADLANEGVQSIVETHSEHLLIRLQQLVASKKLLPIDVLVHYVCADPKTGTKTVHQLELNDRGAFIHDLPGGFFPEREHEIRSLALARAKA